MNPAGNAFVSLYPAGRGKGEPLTSRAGGGGDDGEGGGGGGGGGEGGGGGGEARQEDEEEAAGCSWLAVPARPACRGQVNVKSKVRPELELEWSEPREAEKIFFIRGK